jgi:signal transduction histidine kinase
MGGKRRRRLRQRMGAIRVRTTIAAIVVVGLSLVLAGVGIVTFLQRSLRENVRTAAIIQAEAIADGGESSSKVIKVGEPDEEFVQVLDDDGRVIGSSINVSGRAPLARLKPGQQQVLESVPFENGAFLAVATSTKARPPLTVVVGRSLEIVKEAGGAATRVLAFVIPLLVLIVGAVTFRLTGHALAPVEAIRGEVEAISGRQLHRRVPIPGSRDEITSLATTMNSMLDRLEDSYLRQRRFVSDASHELRSPVAAIRQEAEVTLAHPETTTTKDLAKSVLDEGMRLQRIVDDLLLLTSMDEGTAGLETNPIDLDDLVFEEAERLGSFTGLKIDVADVSEGVVRGDRTKIERLVRNLTDNAERHATTSIRLAVRQSDGNVVMQIDDDGPGVPADRRNFVFERFSRLDGARARNHGGAGLGLAIVSEIAAAHGGTVAVTEAPLGGARFEVVFPRDGGRNPN